MFRPSPADVGITTMMDEHYSVISVTSEFSCTFSEHYSVKGGGARGDWVFRISDLVKNPDGIDI